MGSDETVPFSLVPSPWRERRAAPPSEPTPPQSAAGECCMHVPAACCCLARSNAGSNRTRPNAPGRWLDSCVCGGRVDESKRASARGGRVPGGRVSKGGRGASWGLQRTAMAIMSERFPNGPNVPSPHEQQVQIQPPIPPTTGEFDRRGALRHAPHSLGAGPKPQRGAGMPLNQNRGGVEGVVRRSSFEMREERKRACSKRVCGCDAPCPHSDLIHYTTTGGKWSPRTTGCGCKRARRRPATRRLLRPS